MINTKRRIYSVDIVTVIIIVLATIAVTITACRYHTNKSEVEDLEIIAPTPPTVTSETPLAASERIVEPPVVETEAEAEAEPEPESEYISLGEFRITAYCACEKCCGTWANGRPLDDNGNPIVYGASGRVLIPGYSIAVDPDVIPYGTTVYIDGREYVAHDTGGAIEGNRIDIYMGSHTDALEWGVQYREII